MTENEYDADVHVLLDQGWESGVGLGSAECNVQF
jgi:hypothetical protein